MRFLLYESRTVWIAGLLMIVAGLWFRRRGLPDVARLRASSVPTWLSIAAVAFLATTAVYYVTTPSFANNFEPVVATDSILMALGRPIYMGHGTTEVVSTQYGPMTFALAAVFVDAGFDPILASKLSGVVHCLAGLAILGLCVAQRYGWTRAIRIVGITSVLLMTFGYTPYWNRPDSLHVLGAAVVAGSVLLDRRWLAMLLAGVGTGVFLAGAKFLAVLYVPPLIPLFIHRHGLRSTVGAGVIAVALGCLPFIGLSSVSVVSYVEYLVAIATGQYFLFGGFVRAVSFGTCFAIPLIAGVYLLRKKHGAAACRSPLWWAAMLHFACTALLCVPAAKVGSGPQQLLGLIPPMVVQAMLIVDDVGPITLPERVRARLLAVVFGFAGLMLIGVFRAQRTIVRDFQLDRSGVVRAELEGLLDRYKGLRIHMGSGGDHGDKSTYLRPLVVAQTKECLFDPAVVLDLMDATLPLPSGVYDQIREQRFDVFIIPVGGEPFSLGVYAGAERRMFPADFQRVFLASYTRVESGRYFDVWKANRLIR